MSAYIVGLNREIERSTQPVLAPAVSLRQRFIDWYIALPQITRNRAFAMGEIERALDTQGKYLSSIMLELGWVRKRQWSDRGQYSRYWVPPANAGE